jgi:2-dehydro-3-deoxy-D-arabinonate dehydratase
MKIYNTTSGILVEQSGDFRLDTGTDWDALINQMQLHDWLASRHGELPPCEDPQQLLAGVQLPPMQSQELWASGVTYLRSKEERQEESKDAGGGDFYQRVYEAERPELFFKATRQRTVGNHEKVRIRADSTWDVPEPELALVLNKHGEIIGYTIGNDMSSRSIEGENPLYLPQAKTYDGCAALGPCILVTREPFPKEAVIRLRIERDGNQAFSGEVSVSMITRSFAELAGYLFRECSFPFGAILMTGTGIVPDSPFTLQSGDVISISIDHIGTLTNTVA